MGDISKFVNEGGMFLLIAGLLDRETEDVFPAVALTKAGGSTGGVKTVFLVEGTDVKVSARASCAATIPAGMDREEPFVTSFVTRIKVGSGGVAFFVEGDTVLKPEEESDVVDEDATFTEEEEVVIAGACLPAATVEETIISRVDWVLSFGDPSMVGSGELTPGLFCSDPTSPMTNLVSMLLGLDCAAAKQNIWMSTTLSIKKGTLLVFFVFFITSLSHFTTKTINRLMIGYFLFV